jgi:hypothetical protein
MPSLGREASYGEGLRPINDSARKSGRDQLQAFGGIGDWLAGRNGTSPVPYIVGESYIASSSGQEGREVRRRFL